MDQKVHEHKYKNGNCVCGAESKNGLKRRLKREAHVVEVSSGGGLYEALCAKDGKQGLRV